jgi:hypothetical protein
VVATVLVAVGILIGSLVGRSDVLQIVAVGVGAVIALAGSLEIGLERVRARRRRQATIEARHEWAHEGRVEPSPEASAPSVLEFALADPASAARAEREAAALEPYVGRWVALGQPDEVLAVGDSPDELISLLRAKDVDAPGGIFQVRADLEASEGVAPQ